MALTITAANVAPSSVGSQPSVYLAGEIITAGMPVHLSAVGTVMKGYTSGTAGTADNIVGIALNSAASGGFVNVIRTGDFVVGSAITKGEVYYLGETAGTVDLFADLSGTYVTPLFRAVSTTVARLEISNFGVTT
jgi:hypothetical protein